MEKWDVLDRRGQKVGECKKGEVPTGFYHAVVHVWLVDKDRRFLLSKRAEGRHHGGLWETAGGSVLRGEDPYDAARREVKEEIGLEIEELIPFRGFASGDQLITVFVTFYDGSKATPNGTETTEVKLVTEGEFCRMHARGETMPFTYEESLFSWLSPELND